MRYRVFLCAFLSSFAFTSSSLFRGAVGGSPAVSRSEQLAAFAARLGSTYISPDIDLMSVEEAVKLNAVIEQIKNQRDRKHKAIMGTPNKIEGSNNNVVLILRFIETEGLQEVNSLDESLNKIDNE